MQATGQPQLEGITDFDVGEVETWRLTGWTCLGRFIAHSFRACWGRTAHRGASVSQGVRAPDDSVQQTSLSQAILQAVLAGSGKASQASLHRVHPRSDGRTPDPVRVTLTPRSTGRD
jgi:hypothetical protein